MDDKTQRILFMILLTLLALASIAFSGDEDFRSEPSLFADKRAFMIGDVVAILLMEYVQGSNEATSKSDFQHSVGMNNSATGALDFLPGLGMNSGIDSDMEAKGGTTRQGSLKGKISARVVEVLPNGNLRLEGKRSVEVNDEEQVTIFSGIVRPSDIRADNSVFSYLVADATITYRGKGMVNDTARPGILSRFIAWLF